MDSTLVLAYHGTMLHRNSHTFFRYAAFALVAVWLTGPLGAFTKALLEPVRIVCHCPGHAHPEPAPPGPVFSPCDHDASATIVSGERAVQPMEWAWTPLAAAREVIAVPQVETPDGLTPPPEGPPPKKTA